MPLLNCKMWWHIGAYEMEHYYDCEPLNLVKKKPKPVAVVAPSAVVDVTEKCEDDEEEEIKVEDQSPGRKEEDGVVLDVNKNCFWTKENMGFYRPGDAQNGMHSVFNNLASCEPSLLTALYMRSLLPPGGYLGGYSIPPLYPARTEDPHTLWAQQRFWQMVQLNDVQNNNSHSPKNSSGPSLTDGLTISISPPSPKQLTIQDSPTEKAPSKKPRQRRYDFSK